MGKRKIVEVDYIDLLFLLLSCGGFVCAFIGIFVPWMSAEVSSDLIGQSASESMGLFSDEIGNYKGDDIFPLGLVQAFAIIAVAASALCLIVAIALYRHVDLEGIRIKGLLEFLFAVATIVVGVLVAVFSYLFAGSLGGVDDGEFVQSGYYPVVGMYLCAVGTIVSGAAMLLKRG